MVSYAMILEDPLKLCRELHINNPQFLLALARKKKLSSKVITMLETYVRNCQHNPGE